MLIELPIYKLDMEKFRASVRHGDKFIYTSTYRTGIDGLIRPTKEEVVVVRKFPHFVQLVNPDKPYLIRSMTYIELLLQKMEQGKVEV